MSEGDDWRLEGRFRVKQLTDICLAPTVGISVVIHMPAEIQISLICLSLKKRIKKTATTEAEAPTMTVGQR